MERDYKRMSELWANTTAKDPWGDVSNDSYQVLEFVNQSMLCRDVLEFSFIGLNLSKTPDDVVRDVWEHLQDNSYRWTEYVRYHGDDDIHKKFNLWFWTHNRIEYFTEE